MTVTRRKSAYRRGVVTALPFVLMAMPFGMLFGVVASEAGLTVIQTMAFTTVVIAGAAQFTAVQLMAEAAPFLVVLGSALAVNLRMMMYSAALQPHIRDAKLWQRLLIAYVNFDQTYAMSSAEYEARPEASVADKAAFFLGTATPMVPAWIGSTLVGALVGTAIPAEFGLDFALPVMFLAIIGPSLRSLAHVGAALTGGILSLALVDLPFNLGLLVAAIPAMMVGAELERQGYGR